jgi:hypothetical protein
MITVPALTPVAIPVAEPIVALSVLVLLQLPPPAAVRVVVVPIHVDNVPPIVPADADTVTTRVDTQPDAFW